jgi:hypothetical protein
MGGILNNLLKAPLAIYGDVPFLHEEMRSSGPRQSLGGGRPNTEQSRPTDKTGEIAPHVRVNAR